MLETMIKRAAALLAVAVVAMAPGMAAETPVRSIEIADYRSYLEHDHPARQGMRRFAQLVRDASGGAMLVTVRSGALPGTPDAQLATLRRGAAEAPALMLVAATGLAPLAPEFALLDLPWLVRDEREADLLLDGAFGQALLARLEQRGLMGLAWWENGFRQMTSAGAPMRRADDLRGMRFRVVGEPVFVETMRALGAEPVALPFGALREALASGRVAAQDNFLSQILVGRLHELQSSLSLTHHSYSALVLLANPRAWDGFDEAERRILRQAAVDAGRFQRQAAREEERRALARLAAGGMMIVEPEARELDALRARTEALRTRWFDRQPGTLRALHAAATEQGG